MARKYKARRIVKRKTRRGALREIRVDIKFKFPTLRFRQPRYKERGIIIRPFIFKTRGKDIKYISFRMREEIKKYVKLKKRKYAIEIISIRTY